MDDIKARREDAEAHQLQRLIEEVGFIPEGKLVPYLKDKLLTPPSSWEGVEERAIVSRYEAAKKKEEEERHYRNLSTKFDYKIKPKGKK